MKRIIVFIITGFLFSSCAHKFTFQKRKYAKGFYFSSSKAVDKPSVTAHSKEFRHLETKYETKISEPKEIIEERDFVERKEIKERATLNYKLRKQEKSELTKIFSKNSPIVLNPNLEFKKESFSNTKGPKEFFITVNYGFLGLMAILIILFFLLCLFIFIYSGFTVNFFYVVGLLILLTILEEIPFLELILLANIFEKNKAVSILSLVLVFLMFWSAGDIWLVIYIFGSVFLWLLFLFIIGKIVRKIFKI